MNLVGPPESRIFRVGCAASSKLFVPCILSSVTMASILAGTTAALTSPSGIPYPRYHSIAPWSLAGVYCEQA